MFGLKRLCPFVSNPAKLLAIAGSLGIARKKSSFEKLLFLAEDMGLEPTGLLHLT